MLTNCLEMCGKRCYCMKKCNSCVKKASFSGMYGHKRLKDRVLRAKVEA